MPEARRNAMWKILWAVGAAVLPGIAWAGCFWSHVDHLPSASESGAWKPGVYRGLVDAAAAVEIGGALWEGADSRIGRTMWESIDAALIADAAAQGGKRIFGRARPTQGDDPCLWFKGGSRSFPSEEAAVSAGLVMPYVLEYGPERPAAYALLLLPAYVGEARMKNHAHWPSDIAAGWLLGGISAWYDGRRDTPLVVSILPRAVTVGLRKEF
jgi:membrane-associated phospholipid phosphatase